MNHSAPQTIREVPKTGVIFVMAEARARGYGAAEVPTWCNLGQGQPEAGPLPDAPPRIHDLKIDIDDHEYAPVPGLWPLRESVAHLYNELFRRGLPSKYTAENVAISGGGRASLTRLAAAVGRVNLGHFLPDYTAYEELLDLFRVFHPIPIPLDPHQGYAYSREKLREEILGKGLSVLLLSNPCNPTGKTLRDEELSDWIGIARALDCTMVFDEFYGSYVWDRPGTDTQPAMVSAATCVEDVNKDPVILMNGLTKCWRYPGWRVSWTVGPKSVIEAVGSAGSFLDGGANRPLQRAALDIVTPKHLIQETQALQAIFRRKRTEMLERLERLGVTLGGRPGGTFYAWGDLSRLPPPLDNGMGFFRAALDHQVIVVPGEFFDINPGHRRPGRASRFRNFARFSFGPDLEVVKEGLRRLETLVHEVENT
ncbi:MAG: pyridoxal phosphate-dependent aminotransferase [Myxococcales bacterium]|nr:pyridoxal phosphate-dependent aminotransferase [Myxococcales bacterium]